MAKNKHIIGVGVKRMTSVKTFEPYLQVCVSRRNVDMHYRDDSFYTPFNARRARIDLAYPAAPQEI